MKIKLFICLFLIIAVSCNRSPNVTTNLSDGERVFVDSLGGLVSVNLKLALQQELSNSIKNYGIVAAIEFCNREALQLTGAVAGDFTDNIELKRTSFKFRNPQNAPDEYEKLALEYYEKMILEDPGFSTDYIQKISGDGGVYFYYYQPLKINALCLNCHGRSDQIDPEVAGILVNKYPGDKATGYGPGDFRGLIRVKIIPGD